MALLGFAWQHGLIPLQAESIERTLELNGTLVADNILAFRAGRKFAVESSFMGFSERPDEAMFPMKKRTLEELLEHRVEQLTEYQDSKYAEKLRSLVGSIQRAEVRTFSSDSQLTTMVIETYYKLLATKDEYEVARLLTHKRFQSFLTQRFDNIRRQSFALAPTWIAGTRKSKVRFGKWFHYVLKLLSKFKGIRGSVIDPFKYSSERKFELFVRTDFEEKMSDVCERLNANNLHQALELVQCYSEVKGFGHVKEESWERVSSRIAELSTELQTTEIKPTPKETLSVA